MRVGTADVDLAEAGELLADHAEAEFCHQPAEAMIDNGRAFESDFGAGTQADGDIRLVDRGKATRERVSELGGDQLVADLGRAAGNGVEAIIAH